MKLDHAIIGVADLDAATRTYEAILGVPAAVRSEHPAYGTRNALFLFERGPYLELLAVRPGAATTEFTADLVAFLERAGGGLFGLALTSPEMEATVARLRDAGVDVADAAHGTGRDAEGRTREWRNTRVPSASMHGAFTLLIEHQGWDWRADLRRPPMPGRAGSAVRSIHHIVFDVPDAEAASARWQRTLGLSPAETITSERMGATVIVHLAGEATIEAVSPVRPDGAVAERMRRRGEGLSSIAFEVDDVQAAVNAVRAAGVVVGDPAPGVLPGSLVARIDPASACGVAAQLLQFV